MAKEIKEKEVPILSEELVWDMLQFAQSQGFIYPSAYTPTLVNARMRDITLLSGAGGVASEDKVAAALGNPKSNEETLLEISENLEYTSMPYRRMLDYMSNLPAWDLTYYCKNAEKSDEYKSNAYKKDLAIVKDFTYRFDYKKEFASILKEMFRAETYYGILRDEGNMSFVMQQLPPERCLITGKWDYGFLFSFDYAFFMNSGINMDMFPPIFKETYHKIIMEGRSTDSYNPALPIDLRGDSHFTLWGDCSPDDGFWCWKMQPNQNTRIPYFSGLFPDLAMQPLIRGLQRSSYMAAAAKLVMGSVPFLEQKASLKDAIAISPKILGEFLQLVKAAVNNDAVKVASAPLDDMKAMEFKSDTELYSSYLHTTLGSSGINANLLFSSDAKPNQVETYLSADVDSMISTGIYPWFNKFMEYQINKRTSKYKFGIEFEGTNFYIDRQRRLDKQITLMGQGIVNPVSLSAAMGKNPFAMQAQLDEARAMGWVDKLTPIVPAAQLSGVGAPQKSEDELSEGGAETRDRGSNISKTKK